MFVCIASGSFVSFGSVMCVLIAGVKINRAFLMVLCAAVLGLSAH